MEMCSSMMSYRESLVWHVKEYCYVQKRVMLSANMAYVRGTPVLVYCGGRLVTEADMSSTPQPERKAAGR
jgi:hypothetical protein